MNAASAAQRKSRQLCTNNSSSLPYEWSGGGQNSLLKWPLMEHSLFVSWQDYGCSVSLVSCRMRLQKFLAHTYAKKWTRGQISRKVTMAKCKTTILCLKQTCYTISKSEVPLNRCTFSIETINEQETANSNHNSIINRPIILSIEFPSPLESWDNNIHDLWN